MDGCHADGDQVVLSYDMNRLQRLASADPWVVTLNATERLDPASVVMTMAYEHPLYTPESVAAQARLPELQDGVVAFAGAYHGWGFHEDGALSGLRAAESLGVRW
jgi:predicted NAD/FAD-binding protein